MYKINDYLIYKREVCQVKALTKINNQDYYILENKADSSLKISVPLKEEKSLLRPLSTFKEITKSLDNIDNPSKDTETALHDIRYLPRIIAPAIS